LLFIINVVLCRTIKNEEEEVMDKILVCVFLVFVFASSLLLFSFYGMLLYA